MAYKILIVDDDPEMLEMLKMNCEHKGHQVFTAEYGEKALRIAEKEIPDLALIDLNLPDIDGLEVCRRVRKYPRLRQIPMIAVTARNGKEDELKALLDAGFDDYYIKDGLDYDKLCAKITAFLRKKSLISHSQTNEEIVIGDLKINNNQGTVIHQNKKVQLSKTEFKVFSVLLENSPNYVSRAVLRKKVWNGRIVEDHNIAQTVSQLRGKFGQQLKKRIGTCNNRGYRYMVSSDFLV